MEVVSKRRIYKNLCALSAAFLLIEGAYYTLEGLQSSIHDIQGLGLASVMTLYICYGLSMFYSSAVVKRLGAKWSLAMASFVHTSFVLIQYYPRWWSIVPISGLVGVVSGPFWLAEFVYIQKLTKLFVKYILSKSPEDGKTHHNKDEQEKPKNKEEDGNVDREKKDDEFTPILRKFTDIFFAVFSASVLIGNLPAALILSSEVESQAGNNATTAQCGIDFCPLEYSNSATKSSTDSTLLRVFIGVCLFINLCGVSTILFILEDDKQFDHMINENTTGSIDSSIHDENGNISRKDEVNNSKKERKERIDTQIKAARSTFWKEVLQSAQETLRYVIDVRVVLIVIPFWLLRGIFQGVFFSVFTLAYITCAMNIKYIGFHFLVIGAAAVILNFITSWLTKLLQVSVVLAFYLSLQLVVLIGWYLWTPSEGTIYILFLLAAGHGIISYGTWSQFQALIGFVFREEKDPAYGIGNQCTCIGVILITALFQFACVTSLVYIQIAILAISVINYLIFELYYKPRYCAGQPE